MEITLHRITLTSRTVINFYTTHIFPYLCYHSFLKIILIIFINSHHTTVSLKLSSTRELQLSKRSSASKSSSFFSSSKSVSIRNDSKQYGSARVEVRVYRGVGYPRWQKATVDKLKQCGAPLPLPAPRCAPHFASARAFSSFFLPLPSPPHRLSCRPRYFLFLSTVSRAVFSGTGDARPAEKGRLLTTGPTDDSHESMNETLQASLQSFDRRDDFE